MRTAADPVPTACVDSHELKAWRALLESSASLTGAIERDLNDFGFTLGDFRVLMHLDAAPDGALRMSELAERLHLSPSGLTRRLDGLVSAGYVIRQGLRSDRRVMMAVLTDDGRRVLARVAPVHIASMRRRFFDHVSDAEIDVLDRVFTRLARIHDDAADDSAFADDVVA